MVTPNNHIDESIVYLEPCDYPNIGSYTKVLSKGTIGNVIRLHLNPDQCKWVLKNAIDVKTQQPVHVGTIERESNSWYTLFSNE